MGKGAQVLHSGTSYGTIPRHSTAACCSAHAPVLAAVLDDSLQQVPVCMVVLPTCCAAVLCVAVSQQVCTHVAIHTPKAASSGKQVDVVPSGIMMPYKGCIPWNGRSSYKQRACLRCLELQPQWVADLSQACEVTG
jgi:hypothetical protein